MSASDTPTQNDEDPIAEASAALKAAIERVSVRLTTLKRRIANAEQDVDAAAGSDVDRARLAEALDAARAREAELEAAVETAATAVDAALAELTAAQDAAGEGEPSE